MTRSRPRHEFSTRRVDNSWKTPADPGQRAVFRVGEDPKESELTHFEEGTSVPRPSCLTFRRWKPRRHRDHGGGAARRLACPEPPGRDVAIPASALRPDGPVLHGCPSRRRDDQDGLGAPRRPKAALCVLRVSVAIFSSSLPKVDGGATSNKCRTSWRTTLVRHIASSGTEESGQRREAEPRFRRETRVSIDSLRSSAPPR